MFVGGIDRDNIQPYCSIITKLLLVYAFVGYKYENVMAISALMLISVTFSVQILSTADGKI